MEIIQKAKILKNLNTKELVKKLKQYEDALEKALNEQMTYASQNHSFIVSRGSDCQEVKRILAELTMQTPTKEEGKKFTVADRETWLVLQRKENKELTLY
ncbi:unnamed protein product [marine sediment metagenome]|uniref:Uncharacterized protein n=1 Tax=marine sediment metagenome TaxID=412755 RepID=X1V825_9ZZZZ